MRAGKEQPFAKLPEPTRLSAAAAAAAAARLSGWGSSFLSNGGRCEMQIDVFFFFFRLRPLDIYHTKRTDSVLEKAPSSPTLTTAPRTDRESHGCDSLRI